MAHSNGVLKTGFKSQKKIQNRFFAKMAVKTTSGSGFYFIFVFYAIDLVEKAYNIEEVPRHFLRYLGQTLQNLEIMQMSCMHSALNCYGDLWPLWPLITVPNLSHFHR